ncbi:Arc family DNA-binding protein [Stenotrophomonas sp. TWI377]|uniref:Arc family DNA-binding protein n=1 Tax=Stenotrophomonas sp. TWI377 TaxID=3136775 RepID=UPI00320AA522
MNTPDLQFKLRLPSGLKAKLEDHANATGRSLSAEIVHRLERSFDPMDEYLGSMGLRAQIAGEREMARSTVEMMDRIINDMTEQQANGSQAAYPTQAAGQTVDQAIKDATRARDMFKRVVDAATLLLSEIAIAEAKNEHPDVSEIRKRAKEWGVISSRG